MVVMIVKPENAYCMNLDSRTDRWEQIQKDFADFGNLSKINIKRVSAIRGEKTPQEGVCKTFKSIIKMAKEAKLEYVLVLEDDCYIIESQPVIDSLDNAPEDWDLLIGGAYYYKIRSEYNQYWKKVMRFCSLHFIIVNSRIYDKILGISDMAGNMDVVLSKMTCQNQLNTYLMHPMPCQQRPGFSDLRKKEVNDNTRKLEWIDSPNTFK